jgi:hypothetical protein
MGSMEHEEQGTQELAQPPQKERDVEAGGGKDGIDTIAVPAFR